MVREGGQGRPHAARSGSLDGPVGYRQGHFDGQARQGLLVASCPCVWWWAGRDALVVSRSPRVVGVKQAGARLLGHVFAGSRCRVRAWSGSAQPAVLNHMMTTLRGAMPIFELSAGCVRAGSVLAGRGEATDVSVAETVKHQGE